ncbi:hypothetical protein ACM614_15035 [Streptomyces sp. 12297]
MFAVVRLGRSLTAVFLSTVIAWGTAVAAAAPPVQARVAEEPAIVLTPAEGLPGIRVGVYGSGFGGCHTEPDDDAAPVTAGTVSVTWEGGGPSVVEPDLDTGIIETDVTAPSDASPGTYTVTATCSLDASITASATFTVLTGSENPGGTTEYYPAVELDPAEGPAGTSPVSVAGSEFNCLGVDLLWDGEPLDAAAATDGGEFATQVAVPTDAAEGQYTVRAQCAADPGTGRCRRGL